ncbi:zinc ribbon domain-containing protein [Allocoprobacillus halotolerans]|uniref:Zinc ribbon domain-containing protein n=1 Tax=Allocoprobacillus halotolerans TaxID=2944914 RepID=A0ABY5I4J5_9FIRM|nr:zinc ribbon domain-containing protein [Allocoprobacillus halotolerans]UTY39648.1 zinc ribbon domain-containing protein [Allocoprobacillus halotolerans]
MYCRKCGAKIDDHAQFCEHCGTEVVIVPQKSYAQKYQEQKRQKNHKINKTKRNKNNKPNIKMLKILILELLYLQRLFH